MCGRVVIRFYYRRIAHRPRQLTRPAGGHIVVDRGDKSRNLFILKVLGMALSRNVSLLCRLADLPTAPFLEHRVAEEIRRFVARRRALSARVDRFGNLFVGYRPRRRVRLKAPPIVFAAHMDHPGFAALAMRDRHHVEAEWRGWVPARYFPGARVRFHTRGRWMTGRIVDVIRAGAAPDTIRRAAASAATFGAEGPPDRIIVRVRGRVAPDSVGTWDLPDATIRGHRFRARMCDDVAGVAAVLAALDGACRRRISAPCFALFTRAEEVGFAGALAAVRGKLIPRKSLLVAVEASKAVAGVIPGAGPVLRVGDRATVFDPAATGYVQVVAEELAGVRKSFAFQRKLMDGGTCESTVYVHHGYRATGICLPLVNYHNIDERRGRIAPESIDLRDYEWMIDWFVGLAEAPTRLAFDGRHPGMEQRLGALWRRHEAKLFETAERG
jgi:endoglucanase